MRFTEKGSRDSKKAPFRGLHLPDPAFFSEAVPIAEASRLASKFFVCRRQKKAEPLRARRLRRIPGVFQVFWAKADGKFAVKMLAAAIGTASYSTSVAARVRNSSRVRGLMSHMIIECCTRGERVWKNSSISRLSKLNTVSHPLSAGTFAARPPALPGRTRCGDRPGCSRPPPAGR